ncbi:hypothetical protein [Anaerotignum sp.]|uniref:hypothetical protein n=1 Tax=Anaerotignum sp. TaxID=2039241 RepID=UPI0028A998FC|nr:hypothetical protein [Anaerotignum sp.]
MELIQNHKKVYYRHGVWNQYEHKNTVEVASRIMNSEYGADVCEKDGELYVSIPAAADMW